MSEILSRENYINLAARLDDVDAENLLDFIRNWLQNYPLSNQDDLGTLDVNRRARQFMSAVISTMHDVPLSSNIPYDPDNYTIPLLLSILNVKKVRTVSNWNKLF
jgi:hypothetical protein